MLRPAGFRRGAVALFAAVLLVGLGGCGSGLDRDALRDANGSLTSEIVLPAADARAPGTGAEAGPIADGQGTPDGSVSDPSSGGTAGAGAPTAARTGGSAAAGSPGTAGVGGGGSGGARPAGAGSSSIAGRTAPGAGSGASAAGGRPGGSSPSAADGPAPAPGSTTGAPALASPGGEILLGSFGTASGPIGAQLAAIPVAIRAWVASVNARGGINGRPVRVIFGDDGGDPGKALAIARRMVEEDKVRALFATFGATTIQAVTPYVEQRQVPIIGAAGANPVEDQSPMVFNPQVGADLGVTRAFVTTLVAQSPARKVALLYCREAATCQNGAQRIKEYAPTKGVTVIYEQAISLAQPDYTAEMFSAQRAGAEAVFVYIDFASMIRIERSAHRQGWHPVFVGGVSINEDGFAKGGSEVEGTLLSSATTPYATSPTLVDYREAVARYVPGGQLGGTGATAWVQGKLFERIGGLIKGDITPAALLDALYSLKDETLGGTVPPITFPKGAHATVNLCTVPLKMVGGKITAPLGDTFVCAT
ncbi:MAG: ABC transporter substrate-binding protein [Actinomycetota bacterium]|jgi:branched-chain amino acid transport system substrate-binding protein